MIVPSAGVTGDAGSVAALSPAFASYETLLHRLQAGTQVTHEHSALVDDALAVWARPGFDSFMCLPRLRFDPFAHQLDAAARALRHMQGRAILADEVGLGKTIEAGLVLSELRLRGLAARVLVLVPRGARRAVARRARAQVRAAVGRRHGAVVRGARERAGTPRHDRLAADAGDARSRSSTARPRTRYTVTASAKAMLALHALLPDRAWDAFMAMQFRRPKS